MKKIFTTLLSFGMVAGALAQWTPTAMKGENLRQNGATKFYSLDVNAIRAQLQNAQLTGKDSKPVIISVPTLNGKIERFKVYSLPVVVQSLADRYQLGSYVGTGVDDPEKYIRFSVAPDDFQSMIIKNGVYEFVEPQNKEKTVYGVHPKTNKTSGASGSWLCNSTEPLVTKKEIEKLANGSNFTNSATDFSKASDKKYRTMRLAMSVNGEYTAYHGGTVAGALTAINATLTRCNGIFENDFALHLILQDFPSVIYTDASTDPYSTNLNEWNQQLQTTLTTNVGNDNYDIGHMFGASGGGGNAGCIGCVCINPTTTTPLGKGSGITSPADGIPKGDNFDVDFVAHEMGHQLGANHTFSMSLEGKGQNVEPGSGSTIMGYAGITGATDVQAHSDPYFHINSIIQVQDNLTSKTCDIETAVANQPPVIVAMPDITIPKSTAFVLTAQATDAEGNPITYCWEQTDSATSTTSTSNLGNNTNGPTFRSWNPTTEPVRYFPKLSTVLAGNLKSTTDWEAVSTVARTTNYKVTVRDNNPDKTQQQTQYGTQRVVVGTAGPFKVTSNKVYNNVVAAFTWNPVGTTAAPYNVANVKIDYTTDNGNTWTVLAASTPNDGTEELNFNTFATNSQLTIRVSALGNVFYAVGKVTVSEMMNCNGTAPAGLAASEISQTGAKIDWDAVANATYTLRYKKAADTNWTEVNNLTTNTYTISGLVLSTAYDVSVANVCSGSTGAYATTNFTTKEIEYCTAGATSTSDEKISNVTFANINNNSTSTAGYEDFTAVTGNVNAGQTYNFSASFSGASYDEDQVLVWIDLNQDGDFDDAGEGVLVTTAKKSPWTGSIAIPATAKIGQTRMRVRLHDSTSGPNATPCGTSDYGQVEDYTLNVGQLAVSDVKKNSVNVYPNPAKDIINISNVSSKAQFEIYSVGGQLVNQGITDGKVNVSKLTKGVYILTVESNGEKSQTKFIKN
ncbi:Por secretion system C-terminal sorting domain-containing protein [Epilithonimonas bovis DSM 19482]|uniref:Por secretion system C-terminal sorting domain-containing protein n=1 Tax=Epilithonimonas bovis DSM 19482 TaxID=1121284 RepID=A0A1U7Q012_9FLAO|nr:zinc-dependent metalloprotease family protein [Epilithonimonas bovis]SIT97703.1 Por secretion system C-terminal sorting domain-containing protein [Epilithonimonas bovis DSM 19482]